MTRIYCRVRTLAAILLLCLLLPIPSLRAQSPTISPLQPPEGAPNVVVVLLDDVGFGATSTFGGPIYLHRCSASFDQ